MNAKYNTIEFVIDRYTRPKWDNPDEEEADYDELFEDIKSFIKTALKNDYQMKIWSDGSAIVVEYNYFDECMSDSALVWLGENEYIDTYGEDEQE